jgi:hypothetical protein
VAMLLADVVETDHWRLSIGNRCGALIPCGATLEVKTGTIPLCRPEWLMPFEILHGALVLFGGGTRLERPKIAPLAGFRIHLSGIEPVFTRLQFSDHGITFGPTNFCS